MALHSPVYWGPAVDKEPYVVTPLEAELSEGISVQDGALTLANADRCSQLCLTAIQAAGHRGIIVLGECIGEEGQFHCFLQAPLPHSDVRALGHFTPLLSCRNTFEDVGLVEP
ncbi:hypothetical protein HPB50_005485 [Hyalomma asiaticum]|uniref:Uncharacterized protein n=1 Tax=Hyalomma asiaticum TaxID=266040 RepID=A0ACB7TET0_HYAAI|nr:hypothetical protein HPB50_005485 [Hyalomma asiaticum]